MKTILYLSCLLVPFAFGPRNKSVTLSLHISDCRNHNEIGYRRSGDTIQFYQNNTLVKEIVPRNYSRWPIELENFKAGTYVVNYRNLFDKKISKIITIPDSSEQYDLELCLNGVENNSFNTLSSLKNGEKIEMLFTSEGCFHYEKETLVITRSEDVFYAHLNHEKKIVLTPSHVVAFTKFENELRELNNENICTTTDNYSISSPNWNFQLVDGSCSWRGFYFLIKALFEK
jgi:hypothetical protein